MKGAQQGRKLSRVDELFYAEAEQQLIYKLQQQLVTI